MYHHTQTYCNLLYNSFCNLVYFVCFIPLFCISFYFLHELNKNYLFLQNDENEHNLQQVSKDAFTKSVMEENLLLEALGPCLPNVEVKLKIVVWTFDAFDHGLSQQGVWVPFWTPNP